MSSTASLLYAFDPLCGWCYGFIPAMEALSRALPRLTIELGFGGLVTGARIRPYAESRGYIEGASERLFAVTKQKVRPAFFERVLGNSAVVASSIPPCAALLQVRAHAPDRVLELAHALQRAHFEHGEDLNDPAHYARLLAAAGIDLSIELPPVDRSPPALAEEFRAVRALGGTSFPTVMVRRPASIETLPISYDPPTWIDTVTEALGPGQWR